MKTEKKFKNRFCPIYLPWSSPDWQAQQTTGTYIESATGIDAGGRTGVTAMVVAILFSLGKYSRQHGSYL